jgi:hypothetical protein
MHQLVRDMGREIARQESPKCQRIWHHMEAFTVLKETSVRVTGSVFLSSWYLGVLKCSCFYFLFSFIFNILEA